MKYLNAFCVYEVSSWTIHFMLICACVICSAFTFRLLEKIKWKKNRNMYIPVCKPMNISRKPLYPTRTVCVLTFIVVGITFKYLNHLS